MVWLTYVCDFISLLFHEAKITLNVERVNLLPFRWCPASAWTWATGIRKTIGFITDTLVAPTLLRKKVGKKTDDDKITIIRSSTEMGTYGFVITIGFWEHNVRQMFRMNIYVVLFHQPYHEDTMRQNQTWYCYDFEVQHDCASDNNNHS